MRHMVYIPGLVWFALLYSSRKEWQLRLSPGQTASLPTFVINLLSVATLSYLCPPHFWLAWQLQFFFPTLPLNFFQTPQPSLYTLINSQSTNTLPTLAMEDAVCFRGSGRSHLLKHMTGNPVRVQGSGAKGSLELGRVWKELSQKLRNLAQYKAC